MSNEDKAKNSDHAGVWLATIGTLAGMATVIGLFNHWPTHETVGSLIVAVICGTLATLAFRAANRWREL